MTKSNKTPLTPTAKLRGRGRSVPVSKEGPHSSSRADPLKALDGIMTASLRQSGRLPVPKTSDAPKAATAPPEIKDFDPLQIPVWTLLMALAWIATRDLTTVTWQRNDWRRANGLPDGSIPIASIGATEGVSELLGEDEDDADDPTAFRALEAFSKLRSAGEAGTIEVHAMSASQGRPIALRSLDWTYGKLSFDHRYEEVWRVGGDLYHTLTVEREDLLRAFPATSARPGVDAGAEIEAGLEVGPQGLGQTVQILADAIWHTWRAIPTGFPRRADRFKAVWEAAISRQPALQGSRMPSDDSFERAEKAILEHLGKK